MTTPDSFAARVHARYPEGLTGIIAVGGTRTTFILENNRHQPDPGHMPDFTAYGDRLLGRYHALTTMFFELGGQNLVMPVLAYQRFTEKGREYAELVSALLEWLINERSLAYYRDQNVDPYFAGIDTLLHLPAEHFGHVAAANLARFQQTWDYQPGRRKLIWEVAPVPLFSVFRAREVLGEPAYAALEAEIAATTDLDVLDQITYRYYARALYGTEIPMPHFYLGSNRKGDLKLRSMLPFALYSGSALRLYYTPYPSLFTTRATLQAVIDDLAFGPQSLSRSKDYRGMLTPEAVEAQYERYLALSEEATSTVGLLHRIANNSRGP